MTDSIINPQRKTKSSSNVNTMKKLINKPENYVDEVLDGLVVAHPSLTRDGTAGRVIRRTDKATTRKVGIATGGGSGHLPLFPGYVGEGLIDSCSIGNVFEGPNAKSCVDAIRFANYGKGVLCLFGNYGGDKMNFEMARELVEEEGIETSVVLGTDDIASAAPDERNKRRGVAGIIYAYKVAGALADQGANLNEVTRIAQKAIDHTRTIGVAVASCRVPTSENPTFVLEDNEIELGMGIHGEPGIWRDELKTADNLVDEMLDRLLEDLPVEKGARVSILVNGLGATPLEELFILYRRVAQRLGDKSIIIVQPMVGNYVTSMEMAGASISLFVLDGELEPLLAAPAICPFWKV